MGLGSKPKANLTGGMIMRTKNRLSLPNFYLLVICFSCGPGAEFSGKSSGRSNAPEILVENDAIVNLPAIDEKVTVAPVRWTRTFPLKAEEKKSLFYTLGGEIVKESIVIDTNLMKEDRMTQQISRPLLTQFFKQGNQGTFAAEKFNQKDLGILDLLIIVDNSRSMEQEQINLSQRLGALLSKINDSDWRMNIVTTDPKDGCSRGVFKKGESDLAKKFESAVTPGIGGSGYEEGIRMAVEGLSCKTANWLRPNSSIAILFVSDEDNCSQDGVDCKNSGYDNEDVLIEFLEKKLGRIPGKTARAYGIFWEPGTTCNGAQSQANQYSSLVKKTSGQAGSICDADFTPTLNRISADVNEILVSELELKNAPVPSSLKIKVDGVERTSGFRVINNRIHFDVIPPYGSQIEVSYFHTPTPIMSVFPVTDLPALETIQVVVNNRVIDPKFYTFDETQKSIIFSEVPPENAEIRFQARKRDELKQEFALGKIPPALVSSVLQVENRQTDKYQLVETGGELIVKLEQPPKDGEKIVLTLNIKGGLKRVYPLSLIGNRGFGVSDVYDFDTGLPVIYSLQSQTIEFDPDLIIEGQRIQIAYSTPISKNGILAVPSQEVLDSLKISPSFSGRCGLDKDFDKLEAHLACDLPTGHEVELIFESQVAVNRQVNLILGQDEIQGAKLQEILTKGELKVFIDQVETKDFSLEGPILTLRSVSGHASELRIEITLHAVQ